MAIQVKNPFIGAVSITLSTSRTSPSRCTVIGGTGTPGVPFAGSAVGYGTERAVGRNFTITEYVDNSTYLDRNNIILFRRGMPSESVFVSATIRVPRILVTSSRFGGVVDGNVSFYDQLRAITVSRLQSKTDGILGRESWADNPCSSSTVRYEASEATALIGAPNIGDFLVSYEGQYRSVLSSIYNDAGYSYWWNFTSAGIGLIQGTPVGGAAGFGANNGCNILSSSSGTTLEGTRSHSSYSYEVDLTEQIRTASFSRRYFRNIRAGAVRGLLWPSGDELINQLTGGVWYKYQALSGKRSLKDFGWDVVGDASPLAINENNKEWKQGVGWDDDKDYDQNWNELLGIPKTRKNLLTNQVVDTGWSWRDGVIYLVRDCPPFVYRVTRIELYYPHSGISFQAREMPANDDFSTVFGGTFRIVNYSYSVQPQASGRGFNPCQQDDEYLLGVRRVGHWRGPQFWSPDDAEEGVSDNSNFWFGLALQEAIADCATGVDAKAWLQLELLENPKMDKDDPPSGTLHHLLKYGYKLVWLKGPNSDIKIYFGYGAVNCNDLAEVSGFEDPNDLTSDPLDRQPTIYYKGVCRSAIDEIQEKDQEELQDPNIDAENVEPGLTHAYGNFFSITCDGYKKRFVSPSLAPYIVVGELTASYDLRGKLYQGSIGTGSWVSEGSLSAEGSALSHTVSVTDVTPPNDGSPISVPESHGGGSIGWSKITAIDFCCPINSFLESLSASLSSEGFNITYNYRDISPITPVQQKFTLPKLNGGGFVTA